MTETIPYGTYTLDMNFLSELGEKISKHRKPIAHLLNNRHKYGLAEFPSFAEYLTMLETADPRFKAIISSLEDKSLQGESYSGAIDALENDDFLKLKGNQIVHGMVAKDRSSVKKEDDAERKGGQDVLKLLDKIDPSILAGIKDQIECK